MSTHRDPAPSDTPSIVNLLRPDVLARSRRHRLTAQECVVREGEQGSSAFILLSGTCHVVVRGESLTKVRPGELFGDIGFIERGARMATIRAADDCEVLEISADDLRSELQRSPELLDEFLRCVARRMRETSTRETDVRDEHRDLRKVMERLLPSLDRFQTHPAVSVDVVWRPLTYASGDYYDVVELSPTRLLFALGDVMGHGAPTVPTYSIVRAQLLEIADATSRADDLLTALHRHIRRYADPEVYMTLALLLLDLDAASAEIAVAGPPAPLRYRAGTCGAVTAQIGWTLGYPFDSITFSSERIDVAPGDRFLLYTDGVSDASRGSDDNEESFGLERITRTFCELGKAGATGMSEALFAEVDAFRAGRALEDDATAMVVTVR